MRLVICEKPSVAKAYSDVLGAKNRKDGAYEGNGYIISWCVGHLLGLAEPQEYDEKYKAWRYEDLPILPTEWKYVAADKTKKQLKILCDLIKRSDVDCIVNATDAGREGELIGRLVLNYAKTKKPVKRLWINSMEESAILDGFRNLKDSAEYDNLYHSALCRQQADWAVGMNFSRLFSVIYNANLRVGRVQTPTLAMIVEREDKISNFVKEPYYNVSSERKIKKINLHILTFKEKERFESIYWLFIVYLPDNAAHLPVCYVLGNNCKNFIFKTHIGDVILFVLVYAQT